MDFFEEEANSFDENQCEDIETLRKMYNYYKGIFNFRCERDIKTNTSDLWSENLDIVQISRSICLMNLAQSDDFQFFDCPSLEEMFKCAFMQPLRIIFHFKQTVSQSLMNLVQIIHQNHRQFAGKVIKYFKDDLSLHTLFSLSTFPALYAFFNTQDIV
ncbi:hypothetical protein TVAG_339500 [Trichomonas vaginalis G3]|uniref:Uncharacterized protein n=1 Tax=Trichomonas vaginalis (strain ATCC PRA-98 / G3) TaxID=412133 RepID=A2F906_TRIV3|nr:hypothetical protein TVAG_339500 [Trichomonas vaginalis G3]|eukprot:XP_001311563.1 hypothetical protein [Trichomonas vaginalis G3]